jgi:hypothetical protein
MNKEVTKTTTKDVYTFAPGETWGAGKHIDSKDIIIPKIQLMQKMSELVDQGKAKAGEFVNSLEGVVIGSKDKPVELIVLDTYKTIQVFENNDYKTTLPYTPDEAAKPYEETVGTIKVKRSHVTNFYVLLVNDIKKDTPFPLVLSFKGTSSYAGRKLNTMLMKLQMLNRPSAGAVFSLTSKEEENDKGKYYVMDVSQTRATTDDELVYAKMWYDTIKQKGAKVDEKED